MGKLYSLISALLLTVSATFAAAPDSYEWWFDHDVSSAQSGTVTDGKVDLQIDTSDLPKGIHYFNLRLAEGGSTYGSVYRKMFHSFGSDNGAMSYEYWFDSDYDAKQTGSLNVGSNHLDLDISSLPQGAHYFNIRLGYGDGSWGSVYRNMVLNLAGNVNAVAYEYWIDNDYSAKIEGELSPGANSYAVDLAGVRRGLHRFSYRIMTGEGVWGAPFTSYFYSESNAARFTQYEYWLDNDYANRVTGNATGNSTSFDVDLSGFDKSGGAHYFHLRTRDDDGEWSTIYHKHIIFTQSGMKQPIIGYRQFINGTDLGYVELERQIVDSYMFEVNIPDSLYSGVNNLRPSFDGDRVFLAGNDSIDYIMQIRTELGWDEPKKWKLGVSNDFATTAIPMAVNTKHIFPVPSSTEFAAIKFTAPGDSLYFRSDIFVALDIYKAGEKVAAFTPEQVKAMVMLKLTAGEYFGVLHSVEDTDAKTFTLHLMDTPNSVPMPVISFEEGLVSITCTRQDATIRYTLDGSDPDEESPLYSEPFRMTRNCTVKARAWVEGSDIEASPVAEFTVDTYKAAAPVAEFDLANRLLTLTSGTKDAAIRYTFEYDPSDSTGGVWTDYVDPIQIRKNCTVYSHAVFDGYKDSDITVTEITSLPDSVPMPKIEFDKGIVTISCAEKDAEIHYTLDGTRPTGGSTRYGEPFSLRRNATIMAMAFMPGLDIDSSRVATRVVDSYKVATPKGSFDVATKLLTLTCDTVGASILYTFDREGEWTAYSESERIRMRKNGIVYAKAAYDGYNDSDVAEIVVSELPNEVIQPEILCDGNIIDGNAVVVIKCVTEGALIRYSFDDEEPTMESTLYEREFSITRNTRINAFAYIPDLDIEPSNVSSIMCDVFHVDDLRYDFNEESKELTIECNTEGAKILYTFDPNGEWTEYTAPIRIRKNCTLYAKAVRDGYYDSDTVTITINSLADSVPVPEISCTEGKVKITCANTSAEIHYTIDDENITTASPLYTAPFSLDRNATIRAFALIPGLDIEPSDIVTKVIDSFKVKEPTGSFDAGRRELTLSCETEDARIFYSFATDGDWTEYTSPIAITRNRTVYAKASRDGWNDSEVSEIRVTELADNVPAPEILFEGGMVSISCANADAEIHYTVDDETLTAESPLYTDPFRLDRNATIRAFALIPGLDIEPSDIVTYVVDSYKVATPYGSFDSESMTLTIECDTESASILYSFDMDGEWMPYTKPIAIEGNVALYAKAIRDGWNDSDVVEIVISDVKCAGVAISYNGRYVRLETDEPDASIRYTVDGTSPTGGMEYTGDFDVKGLCTVRAVAVKPGYMDSEVAELTITRYADEEHAETSAEGLLASAFDWDDTDLPNNLESFRIEGRLNDADYGFISSMGALRHLDIKKVADAHIPANAFSGSGLISVSLPEDLTECGDSILSSASNLSSVIWNSRTMNVGDGLTRGLANPNVLLYVPAEVSVSGRTDLNVVKGDNSESVVLHYGYPYYAMRDFKATRVSLTHEFTQTTIPDTCRGWETIVLPFSPTEITHEVNGPMVPFTAWNEDINGDKPFWLYSATSSGWEEARSIEACVPYIISMPNNPDYVKEFNLGGKVTFSAETVDLGPENSYAFSYPWMEGTRFDGTFMPVAESGTLTLNVNSTEGGLQPGSTFVVGGVTLPFGAYLSGAVGRRSMPVFGDSSGVDMPMLIDPGLVIETPAPGVLKICSGRERRISVTTVTGVLLRTFHLRPGESVNVEGLTRDLYIVAGRKVMVR